MKKALKILRKIFFWIFFISLFLTTTVTVILYVYEDEIKQYAVDELNEYLTTPVEVQDIELSFFHSFPSASIEFKKVFIADAFPGIDSEDTLFHANSMFFNFNIMDIYSGNYKVNRMSVHSGSLQLKTSKDGQTNFDIIKPREERQESNDKFQFLLDLLELEDFKLKYKNLASQQYYDLNVNHGLFQGDFTADQYNIISETDLHINKLKSNSFTLVKNAEAHLDLDLAVDDLAQTYHFKKGDLRIEEMPFHITGLIDSTNIDLSIAGDEIQLADLANSMVDETMDNFKSYESEGVVNFVSHIHGPRSATEMPAIEADFNIENGSITEPKQNLTIREVSFVGKYENQQQHRTEKLRMDNVQMKMLNSFFTGEVLVEDFSNPAVKTSMDGNINLKRFHQFFIFENIEKLSGDVEFHLDAEVQFYDPEFNAKTFDVKRSDGVFNLSNVQYKGMGDPINYKEITGELVLNNKDAAANNLKVRTNRSDLLVNGAMKNLMPFLDGSGNLGLIASIESEFIDLNEFLVGSNPTPGGPLQVFELPNNVNLNVDLDVGKLKWEHHEFTDIASKMLMSDRVVKMNGFQLKTLNGDISGNLIFKNLMQEGNVIDGKMKFNGINIHKLFKEWKNFDQKSITSNNISGNASGDIDLLLVFNPYFSLIEDKLYAKCNFRVEDGELKNLETMKDITAYMRSNLALKVLLNKHIDDFEKRLLNIAFSDIENEITIQDRKINIPRMKIKSSALDIDLFGWHDFDNMIDYHFSFRFRELKQKVEENEFGIIEDDGLGLVVYLNMFGHLDDPDYSSDGQERRVQIKESFKEEKQDVKSMLKSELGFFKKDTSVQEVKHDNRNEIQFIIYDGEQEEVIDSVDTKKKKNKKESSKWFQKWKEEQEQKEGAIEYESEQ